MLNGHVGSLTGISVGFPFGGFEQRHHGVMPRWFVKLQDL
jgi:hypothetical protein